MAAASAIPPPAARTSPARQTQQPSMNDAVPVSTSVTGTSDISAATRAAATVADRLDPTWIERMASAPSVAACS